MASWSYSLWQIAINCLYSFDIFWYPADHDQMNITRSQPKNQQSSNSRIIPSRKHQESLRKPEILVIFRDIWWWFVGTWWPEAPWPSQRCSSCARAPGTRALGRTRARLRSVMRRPWRLWRPWRMLGMMGMMVGMVQMVQMVQIPQKQRIPRRSVCCHFQWWRWCWLLSWSRYWCGEVHCWATHQRNRWRVAFCRLNRCTMVDGFWIRWSTLKYVESYLVGLESDGLSTSRLKLL